MKQRNKLLRAVLSVLLLTVMSVYAALFGHESHITVAHAAMIRTATLPNTPAELLTLSPQPFTNTAIPVPPDNHDVLSALTSPEERAESETILPYSPTKVKAIGQINRKDVRLRADPDPDATILIFLKEDAYVSVLSVDDGWYYVNYDGCVGYLVESFMDLLDYGAAFETYGTVNDKDVQLYASASVTGEKVTSLSTNAGVTVNGFVNGWLSVTDTAGHDGYVSGDYIDLTTVKPTVKKASSSSGSSNSSNSSTAVAGKSVEVSGSGADVAAFALQFEGTPYVYGGAGVGGFDCSGFTMYVFDQFGCSLPHGATSQLNYGTSVDKASLQPGDLVFFQGTSNDSAIASHVGIYIGNGQFIHASSSSGRTVKIDSLSQSYYVNHYLTARRLYS